MSIDLTDKNVVTELLNRAVAENGEDYVYPHAGKDGYYGTDCVYFDADRTPSCIVGHIMAYQGGTADDLLVEDDEYVANYNEGEGVSDLVRVGIIDTTPETKEMLSIAQSCQDRGLTWGESVRLAIEGEGN